MVHASERDRIDVKAKRTVWSRMQRMMHAASLVFLDESGVNTNLTRRYGRAKGKARARRKILCKHMFDSDKNTGNKQRNYEENQMVALPVLAILPGKIAGMHVRRHACRQFHRGTLFCRLINRRFCPETGCSADSEPCPSFDILPSSIRQFSSMPDTASFSANHHS